MKVNNPLTYKDKTKIVLVFPFILLAAVILGTMMRTQALIDTIMETMTK